jgi:hypothetical protein
LTIRIRHLVAVIVVVGVVGFVVAFFVGFVVGFVVVIFVSLNRARSSERVFDSFDRVNGSFKGMNGLSARGFSVRGTAGDVSVNFANGPSFSRMTPKHNALQSTIYLY